MLSTGRLLLVFLRSLLWLEMSGRSTSLDGFRMASLLSGSECCLAAGLLFPCDFSSSDPTPLCGGSSIPETWARKLQRLTLRLRSHGVPCAASWPQWVLKPAWTQGGEINAVFDGQGGGVTLQVACQGGRTAAACVRRPGLALVLAIRCHVSLVWALHSQDFHFWVLEL